MPVKKVPQGVGVIPDIEKVCFNLETIRRVIQKAEETMNKHFSHYEDTMLRELFTNLKGIIYLYIQYPKGKVTLHEMFTLNAEIGKIFQAIAAREKKDGV
jgi:hypothetical protein